MTKAEKKEKAALPAIGGNIKPLREDMIKARDRILKFKSQRKQINADIKAEMENAESKGIPKHALRDALRYYESSPEQREGYHEGYSLCLEFWGMPLNATQAEFFSDGSPKTTEVVQDDTDEQDGEFAVDRVARGR